MTEVLQEARIATQIASGQVPDWILVETNDLESYCQRCSGSEGGQPKKINEIDPRATVFL
jgi:hypothetical protein